LYWRTKNVAKFDVFVNGKIVESFEAEDYFSREDEYIFTDSDNQTVGSIVKTPGMSVKKVPKSGFGQRY
jgi:hypothetical protein